MPGCNRRSFVGLCAAMLVAPVVLRAAEPIRLGLTPVFLDNDAEVIARLKAALGQGTGRPIELVQRRTYQEVTGLLLEGGADAAWLCGYPYLQHEQALALLGVPVWRGQPLYRSYLITGTDDPAAALADLRGGSHAFSDPDSNSGWLVTASDLARMGERPETFFTRTLFTYGHRNVVRAVAGGLMRSGSVDGYVWEALAAVEPGLTARTRVIARSEPLGFPPFVTRRASADSEAASLLRQALLTLADTAEGRAALDLLQLDGVIAGEGALFDGIRARMRDVQGV
ncbi:PhnD/SsuA/transferrin family substrate-binding protein [Rhodobacter sp. Har01]|uniref:substrate-binding domain-containing protein n=1 Tax=Rhodobacter sp. Har01 TaxID=2883999 RepID=UPI001D0896B0|nr:PhnD/SsuA/transferrin family substrate-binding protein [Rhodobacter sp. Har01]MCB6178774.1 PhnD/SsuA/transferrin family substrate-binding protein [Rhodobacter sp. Har01]